MVLQPCINTRPCHRVAPGLLAAKHASPERAEFPILHANKPKLSLVIRACIFDLDGVIVDTAHYHYLAWKRLAHEFGYALTEADNERLKGVSRMQSLDIVLALAGTSVDDQERPMLAQKKNLWFNQYLNEMKPDEVFPGVLSLIRALKNTGILVGLASSSKNAQTVLQLLHLQDEFDTIIDGNMIIHTKPHPEIFLLAAEKLGVDAADCLVVEDAEAGVEAALAAGMKCIGIGSHDTLHRANIVFPRTSDITLSTLAELASTSD